MEPGEAADLIVVPFHGWTGSRVHACGSVTKQLLSRAPVPVLVVPDHSSALDATFDGFHRIVCGIDFSPASLKALRFAGELADMNHASLIVTHVVAPEEAPVGTNHDSPEDGRASSMWHRRLHAAAHADMPPSLNLEDRLSVGNPATEIRRLSDEERCDLIAIGGHRGNPPGCVMNDILMRSRVPVLTIRVAR